MKRTLIVPCEEFQGKGALCHGPQLPLTLCQTALFSEWAGIGVSQGSFPDHRHLIKFLQDVDDYSLLYV